MPKTIRILDIDDDVYAELGGRAAEAGVSIPELLRKEVTRIASRPSMREWRERTRRRPSDVTPTGMWPRCGGFDQRLLQLIDAEAARTHPP